MVCGPAGFGFRGELRVLSVSDESDLVWHYTTTAGLIGVLVEHKLRATSASFVNDPMEQRLGTGAVDAALEKLRLEPPGVVSGAARTMLSWRREGMVTISDEFGFSNRYVACASDERDSLNLWRGYGAHSVAGTFAIGLSRTEPLGLLVEDKVRDAWATRHGDNARLPGLRGGWSPMKYIDEDRLEKVALKKLREGLEEVDHSTNDLSQRDLDLWNLVDSVTSDIEAVYKHKAYEAEKELRLQVELTSPRSFKIAERLNGISAFVELTSTQSWGEVVTSPKRLAVRQVVTWPGAPPQATRGVAAALIKGGHNYQAHPPFVDRKDPTVVHIKPSRVPFV
jgi:hypothetical protein